MVDRNPGADLVAQLVGDPAEADLKIGVVGDQVIEATPADVGKVVTVAADGTLELGAGGGGLDPADQAKLDDISVTQPVDLDQMEADIASLNSSLVLRGTWDASAGTFPGGGTAQAGAVYIVSVAGTVNAVAFAVGDRIVAITDNASTGTFAGNWFKEDYTDQVLSVDGATGAVSLSGTYIAQALLDANTVVIATADNTPIALAMGASTILARLASGNIVAATPAQLATLLAGEVFKQAQEVNAQTGTTYTLVAGDAGKLVTLSNVAAVTLTLPQDSDATIAIGTYVDLYQLGAGQVTVAAGTGATLRTSGLTAKARAQYARFGVQKVSANTWSLFGDLAAS